MPRSPKVQRSLALIACLLGGLGLPALAAEEIQGRILLEKRGREAKLDRGSRVVVYYEPAAGAKTEPPAEAFEIVTVRKEFSPRVLGVPLGSRVEFPNRDTILHNAFSVSGKNRFDLGLYRKGQSKGVVLKHPGVVQVFCNVHHSMVAHVVVAESSHITYADQDGKFRLADLPAGAGKLTAWYERSEPVSLDLRLPLTKPLEIRLEVTKPKLPKHNDKNGRSYSRRRSRY